MRFVTLKSALSSIAVLTACAFASPASATTSFLFEGTIYYSDFGGLPLNTTFSAWGAFDENIAPDDGLYDFSGMGGDFYFSILGQNFGMMDDERWGTISGGPKLKFGASNLLSFNFQMSGFDLLNIGGGYLGVADELGFFDDAFLDSAFGTYALSGVELIDDAGIANGIPEPATWLMMVMGFGLVGAAVRRRSALKTVT